MRNFFLFLSLFVSTGLAAAEGRLTGSDVAEIRAVIHRQIDALRRDDARGAFALVAPGAQAAYGTPERFLDTMRTSYRAVYRPSAVAFLDLVLMGAEVVQPVQLTERSGTRISAVWVAYYAMERQRDGTWRVNGCRLIQPARTISA